MHLTIAGFHARFTSSESEGFIAALRTLPPLDDLRVIPPEGWNPWMNTNEPREEEV